MAPLTRTPSSRSPAGTGTPTRRRTRPRRPSVWPRSRRTSDDRYRRTVEPGPVPRPPPPRLRHLPRSDRRGVADGHQALRRGPARALPRHGDVNGGREAGEEGVPMNVTITIIGHGSDSLGERETIL